jgi:hypothetical protein
MHDGAHANRSPRRDRRVAAPAGIRGGAGPSPARRATPRVRPRARPAQLVHARRRDDPAAVEQQDKADKPAVMSRQKALLEHRYDLRNDASPVMMSGGRKAVQQGVRVRLPEGTTWTSWRP